MDFVTTKQLLYIDSNLDRTYQFNELVTGGWKVDFCQNGWEGMGTALTDPPTAIVLNLVVSVLDGIEFLRLARKDPKLQHLPIFIFSEPFNPPVLILAQEMGELNCLEYPFSSRTMEMIRSHIEDRPPPI